MNQNNVTCTCFILGWIAERHPDVVKRIADAGHEIACHGYNHELIYDLTHMTSFAKMFEVLNNCLEDLTGATVSLDIAPHVFQLRIGRLTFFKKRATHTTLLLFQQLRTIGMGTFLE